MEWRVCIEGESYDLEELSKSLNSPKLCVTSEEKGFILKSKDFNSLKNFEDVEDKARAILALINGAARLTLGMLKPLVVTGVEKVNEDGTRELCVGRPITYSVRRRGKADAIPNWVAIARENRNVARALQLLSLGPPNWVGLYKVYEVIRRDAGNEHKMIEKGLSTKSVLDRFRRTANSPIAIGDESRHGVQRDKPPEDPMKLSEAVSLVKTIFCKWIYSKALQ